MVMHHSVMHSNTVTMHCVTMVTCATIHHHDNSCFSAKATSTKSYVSRALFSYTLNCRLYAWWLLGTIARVYLHWCGNMELFDMC